MQEKVVEHLREYIVDLQDEQQWDESFSRTQSALVAAARKAKQEKSGGKAEVMDYNQL